MIPSEINTAKTFFLVSAILNILFALGLGTWSFFLGAFSCGIGCIAFIAPIINIVSCVMDFMAYNKLNTLDRTGTLNTMQTAAIWEIVTILTGNVVSMVFGIIILSYIGNPGVRNYLTERKIY